MQENLILTSKPCYKVPITEIGKNFLSKIEKEQIKTAKVQFRIEGAGHLKYEYIFCGVRDKAELIKVIDFFCFYASNITLKQITAKEEVNDFYLITVKKLL